jgi:hypothetical protein
MAILLFVHLTRHSSTASEQLSVFLRCQQHHRSTEHDACLRPPAADAYRQLGVYTGRILKGSRFGFAVGTGSIACRSPSQTEGSIRTLDADHEHNCCIPKRGQIQGRSVGLTVPVKIVLGALETLAAGCSDPWWRRRGWKRFSGGRC